MEDYSKLIDGLKKLRTGALLQIISVVLGILAIIYLLMAMGFSMMTMSPVALISGLVGLGFIGLLSGLLLLVGFIYWFTATGSLEDYNDRLGIGKIGVILVIIGTVIAILGFLVMITVLAAHPFIGEHPYPGMGMGLAAAGGLVFFLGIGGILILIGWILFSIMLIRLGDLEEVSDSIHTAGILYLIGIILSLIPYLNIVGGILLLVAVIMIYTGAGSSIDRLQSRI